jgi:hypothetical protein
MEALTASHRATGVSARMSRDDVGIAGFEKAATMAP